MDDRNNIISTEKQTKDWLRRIKKSGHPGIFKVGLYQHGLLPSLMWLLTVYDVLMTSVGGRKERKTAAQRMGEAAERGSCWPWTRREDISWKQ